MKQTVVEYYTQDGSIELAIRTHLKANPNQVVKFMGMTQHNYQGHYSQEVYGVKLQVKVFELDNEENIVNELTHKRIKGTYIAEKIRTIYQKHY